MEVSKLEVAQRQLEMAARLFAEDGDCFSIQTLAGAAEEILGKLLEHENKQNIFERMRLASHAGLGTPMTNRELSLLVNRSRNSIKHANNPHEDMLTYEPCDAAVMLFRSLVNYQLKAGALTTCMEEALAVLRQRNPELFRPGT